MGERKSAETPDYVVDREGNARETAREQSSPRHVMELPVYPGEEEVPFPGVTATDDNG